MPATKLVFIITYLKSGFTFALNKAELTRTGKYTRCILLKSVLTGLIIFYTICGNTQTRILWLNDSLPQLLSDTSYLNKSRSQQKAIADSLVLNLRAQGYLEASIDSFFCLISACYMDFHLGPKYIWKALHIEHLDPLLIRYLQAFTKTIPDKAFQSEYLNFLLDKSISFYEEKGYPFAAAFLDTIILGNAQLSARLQVVPGRYMIIKEVVNAGDAKVSNTYLQRYLGILPGKPFQKSKITEDGKRRLTELPFATQRRDPLIHFIDNEVSVNVFLNKRNASRFDFVLGLLPNARETGRFLITGTANLDLYNQLGNGERLFLQYQSLRPETQEIKVLINYPYLLDLPFGIEGSFGLYSRDSTNRDIQAEFGLLYLLQGGDYLKAFYQLLSTDLVNVNTSSIIARKKLPSFLDVRNSFYGVEYLRQRLDYRFNPRKGWSLQSRVAMGNRNIKINDQIADLKDPNDPDFDFRTLYDTISLRAIQFRGQLTLATYIPMGSVSTIKLGIQSGYVYAPDLTSGSEVYRIGGNRILRGFDEEAIFSSHYQILTAEYRLLTGRNGNIFVFGDFAYVRDQTSDEIVDNFPYGFGAGLNFDTPIGVFGVTFAVGAQRQNPLDFRAARIHFGYVSLF
ncbi:MAG: BamA/TamA family outer membrane protein [Saprospiraceae bacterium]|nr:BamA/TamA family outer membrane protein [Saprospiraceae bacterium]